LLPRRGEGAGDQAHGQFHRPKQGARLAGVLIDWDRDDPVLRLQVRDGSCADWSLMLASGEDVLIARWRN
jgi:hypothetical protein